jgi:choline-sulfatase
MAQNKPHIVVVLSDQHRADVMASAGDPYIRTPNMDRLAREGTRFTDAYCNAPVCGPSRMSLLTGRYPSDISVLTNRHALGSHHPTMAHALAAAGYRSVLAGRMHFIGPDQRHGFHERLVGDHGPTDAAFSESPLRPFDGTTGQNLLALQRSGAGVSSVMQYDDEVTDAAVERIRDHGGSEEPLFLVVGLYGPHNPYICEQARYVYYRKRLPRLTREMRDRFYEAADPPIRDWLDARGIREATDEDVAASRAAYYGLVERTDQNLGRILAAVDAELGRADTMVCYSSDHGEMAGEHGMFFKSSFYDGAARVPLVIRGADVPAGTVCRQPVSLVDLAPTVGAAASAPALPFPRGRDLAALVRERRGATPEGISPEGFSPERSSADRSPQKRTAGNDSEGNSAGEAIVSMLADPRCGPACMVRRGKWKLVEHHRHAFPQLFDLQFDPAERSNRVADTQTDALLAALRSHIPDSWRPEEVERILDEQRRSSEFFREWRAAGQDDAVEHWAPDVNALDWHGR